MTGGRKFVRLFGNKPIHNERGLTAGTAAKYASAPPRNRQERRLMAKADKMRGKER